MILRLPLNMDYYSLSMMFDDFSYNFVQSKLINTPYEGKK